MIFISLCLFALSGKQILQVRRKLKVANCEFDSGETVCSIKAKDRRFSDFARAFMSRTLSTDSRIPPATASNSSKPEAEHTAFEPLAPINSREELDPNDVSPTTTATSISPILDQPASEKGRTRAKTASRFDKIHWKYAKFAFLCTVVLFITWVCFHQFRLSTAFV